ncbi:MAG: class I SAM-dependent methyltransferase [Chloroflexi bacterium]|nr:class I SAM-dependent methyltransferase [Chloroflexota bacterium]
MANELAQDLFGGISDSYDRWAQILSLGQYLRWRSALVAKAGPSTMVLDVSTGRAGVAIAAARQWGGHVIGLDVTRPMLLGGRRAVVNAGLEERVWLVQGRAEDLPFPDRAFDTLLFTFLLRYVSDPEATVREMARVLKPGGQMLSLEFGVPPRAFWRWLWRSYTRAVLPAATSLVSPGWKRVGSFLGPSISRFYKRYPLDAIKQMWARSGIISIETEMVSLGGAVIMWGTKKG